jgi:hypothetical protein
MGSNKPLEHGPLDSKGIYNIKDLGVLAANLHFSIVLISCLHQCFANLNFCRNSQIK